MQGVWESFLDYVEELGENKKEDQKLLGALNNESKLNYVCIFL